MLGGMAWLNYHHLLYFWTVAREGGIAKAAPKLRLAQATISEQIKQLEGALGEPLFRRVGRELQLTPTGHVVFRYADEIFALGRELVDTVEGRPTGRPPRLAVGVVNAVPKLVVRTLLEPAFAMEPAPQLIVQEDRPERLLAELSMHALDMVITDAPVSPSASVRAFNHLLGDTSVTFFAAPKLAAKLRKGFPQSLDGAPMLLPADPSQLRRALDQRFAALKIKPRVVAELEDSALMQVFGEDGRGVFPAPAVIADHVQRQFDLRPVGELPEVRERFYAVSVERKLQNPSVVAICEAARTRVFR